MSSSAITGPIFTDVSRSPSGSAAAPSWSFNASQGTGVYLVSADVLGLSTAGVQRVVVDASGNVGIGTASPEAKLSVFGGNISIDSSSRKIGYITDANASNTGYIIPYDSSGFLSVHSNFSTGGIKFHTGTANTERMRLDASGNLLVGGTSVANLGTSNRVAAFRADSAGEVYFQLASTTSTSITHAYFYNSSGLGGRIITTSATISLANGSDYRIKNIISPLENAVQKVTKLNPVVYEYKVTPGMLFEGFVAHELQEIVPTAVFGEKDEVDENGEVKAQGVDLTKLIPLLTKAIQEQQEIINALEARLAALEAK
jgi:hypothetical protein